MTKVVIANDIIIEDPEDALYEWAENNLTFDNPDYANKVRLGLWVGGTPRKLHLYEIDDNKLILPFGVLRRIFPIIRGCEIVTDFPDPRQLDFGGTPVPLYDYQEEAVDVLYRAKYGILQAPAGSGKTQIGIQLAKTYGEKTLWLTHTADLLNQSKERAEQYMDHSLIGTITAGKVEIGAGITFATVQTMAHLNLAKYKYTWRTIIVDECHRVCKSADGLAMFEKILTNFAAPHKYGLTATVHRSDGLIEATKAILGEVVYEIPPEAVADKIMTVSICPTLTGEPIPVDALNSDGTINYSKLLTELGANRTRNALIAQCIVGESRRSCLILSDRLNQLNEIMEMLPPDLRARAVMIDGTMTSKTAKAKREAAIEQMRTGEKQFLFASYSLAKEGLDIPRLDRLFMATPVKDYAVVIQAIGRIARTYPGKEDPIAYDFIDNFIYAQRAYKQRLRHYRKANCKII